MLSRIRALVLFALFFAALQHVQAAEESPGGAPMPPRVTVAEVAARVVQPQKMYTGRLEAPQRVDIRPRISGYLEESLVADGARVDAGELLFRIDARSFEAEVARLRAEVRSAQARLAQTRSDRQRAQQLRTEGAIAVEQLESRTTAVLEAEANLESLKASLASAELNLSFTEVYAPIQGQLSRASVTPGNYLMAGQTVLTTLVSRGAVDAYFDMDERTFLELTQNGSGLAAAQARLMLADESHFAELGTIDFVDNQIDPATGTIRMRARFNDPEGKLVPGQFVRIRLATGAPKSVLLVQEQALGTDLANRYLLVVGEDSVLQYRPVELGEKLGRLRVIRSGIAEGERVVIRGVQKAFPGTPVQSEIEPMLNESDLTQFSLDSPQFAQAQERPDA